MRRHNQAAEDAAPILILGRGDVRALLDDATCIAIVRDAMIALSRGATLQLPREILRVGQGALGIMPGALGSTEPFGAKVVSVYPQNHARGRQSHQGGVLLFHPDSGAPVALVHAGQITAIRTAAASAVATDVLARPDATRLAILGYGEQARSHIGALRQVRPLTDVRVWGRDQARARTFAAAVELEHGLPCRAAASAAEAAAGADIICTTTGASEPILLGQDVAPGTHLNVVGSSHDGPAEIDIDLVTKARFFGDYRPSVLAEGAEFIRARVAGRIDDGHFRAEIGEVLDGAAAGRQARDDITIYKSLGHVVQDLATAWHVYLRALATGRGTATPFD